MMSVLSRRVGRAIRGRGLWAQGDRVAVAVSGGPDSVALVCALSELSAHAGWGLAGVIHVNHGLRRGAADEDEAFCRALAQRLNLPVDVVAVDVRQRMAATGLSLEAAGRELRYTAFEQAAERLGATVVATGHTQDDQAETVLLRLLRGASARGGSGIRARRELFARPLLDSRRSDVLRYLTWRGESWREDESNADRSIPRNRLRHVLMPVLEDLWPGGVSALARFADLAAEDEAWLSRRAARAPARAVRSGPSGVELDGGLARRLPPAIGRRVVRDAIEMAGGRPAFRNIDAICRLIRSDKSRGSLNLRALLAEKVGDRLTLKSAARDRPTARIEFSHVLPVPGVVKIIETGGVIRASLVTDPSAQTGRPSAGLTVALQADRVALPLTVRSRRPGDRLTPLGAPGRKKLQDLLVDRKVPCGERDAVPIVIDAEGRIVWVAGVAVAERARVFAPEAGMVILEFKKDGS